jgi:MFS family permease
MRWDGVASSAFADQQRDTDGRIFAVPKTKSLSAALKQASCEAISIAEANSRSGIVMQSGFAPDISGDRNGCVRIYEGVACRPSIEFGLYFLMFPFGFLFGNFISSRLSGRVMNEKMVIVGATLSLAAVGAQSGFLLFGYINPLVLFLPGFFVTMAQGISLPFGQAAAMSVNPHLVGMAAGLGVFMQNLGGAVFAQLYGLLSNGTPGPLILTTAITAVLSLVAGAIPFVILLRQQRAT